MSKINGAQAALRCLQAEGVAVVFGYPGGQAIQLFDALYDSPIDFVLARHEQGAVHAADGYARASGKAGVVLVTSGPGATNTVTGIATAYMDSVPLVVISGQVPTSVIGTDSFQESDIFGITLPIVKHSYLLRDVRDLPKTFKEAFYIAQTGRPGPVLIDIPMDVASDLLDFEYPDAITLASYKPTVKGNQKQVRAAASCIERAQRPLILAGGGVVSAGAHKELLRIAERMHIPVACTLMGKGAFPSSNPLSLGAVGMHGSKYTSKAVAQCDLLIAVGCHFSDRVTGRFESFAPQADFIHIDIDPAEIGKIFVAQVPIVGDAKAVLADIDNQLEKRGAVAQTDAWLQQIEDWKGRWPYYDKALPDDPKEIIPEELFALLSQKLEEIESIVTTDVGQHQMWANQFLNRNQPRTFITSGGLGTMGFGLPAAIGASLAQPKKMVVCVAGDGSIQMNIQEMATACASGANVKVLVINNGVLGMVRQWQGLFYEGRYSATTLDCNPDFMTLARAYGWECNRIDNPDDLEQALDTMLLSKGPYLLDCVISPDQNVYPMVPPGGSIDEAFGAIDRSAGIKRMDLPHKALDMEV